MIGIVTVNWNGYDITVRLVTQIFANSVQDFHLIVVNNSASEVPRFCQNSLFYDPRVEVIHSPENVGYAGGLNLGLKALLQVEETSHFLLLNNDVEIEPDFIQKMLAHGKDNDRIYSPLILLRDSALVQNSGGKICTWVGGTINLNKNAPVEFVNKVQPDFLSGCALFMHRSVVERVGVFNEAYGSYYEDVDYCVRAKGQEIGIEILWNVTIRHFHSFSTNNNIDYKIYLLNRNQIVFARKHLSGMQKQMFIATALIRGFLMNFYHSGFRSYWRGVREGLKC